MIRTWHREGVFDGVWRCLEVTTRVVLETLLGEKDNDFVSLDILYLLERHDALEEICMLLRLFRCRNASEKVVVIDVGT